MIKVLWSISSSDIADCVSLFFVVSFCDIGKCRTAFEWKCTIQNVSADSLSDLSDYYKCFAVLTVSLWTKKMSYALITNWLVNFINHSLLLFRVTRVAGGQHRWLEYTVDRLLVHHRECHGICPGSSQIKQNWNWVKWSSYCSVTTRVYNIKLEI